MSISNEIIMIVTAASLGFTVATGVNITYFRNIATETEMHDVEHINRITDFWQKYVNLKQAKNQDKIEITISPPCVSVNNTADCISKAE